MCRAASTVVQSNTDVPSSVLVVEDDEDNRDLLAVLLRERGYQVVTAATGDAAIIAMLKSRFDVAVLDIGLPDMSGIEVARRSRGIQPDTFLIALTGHGADTDRDAMEGAGIDVHLLKPISLNVLEEVIRDRRAP